MPEDTVTAAGSDCEVMASVEADGDGGGDQLIIAELCRDEAYLAMSVEETADVDAWR